jgi:hypothetical protein
METKFDLTAHLAQRETLNCPVLAKAWSAADNVKKIVEAQTQEQRRLNRINSQASFNLLMTRARLNIAQLGGMH